MSGFENDSNRAPDVFDLTRHYHKPTKFSMLVKICRCTSVADGSFDVVVEKGTLDALWCGEALQKGLETGDDGVSTSSQRRNGTSKTPKSESSRIFTKKCFLMMDYVKKLQHGFYDCWSVKLGYTIEFHQNVQNLKLLSSHSSPPQNFIKHRTSLGRTLKHILG